MNLFIRNTDNTSNMNGHVYQVRPLYAVSFFQKLLRQLPEENAVVELNNLLASTPVQDISRQDIKSIEDRYRLSLKKEFALNLEEFYSVYLNYCLRNSDLNKTERDELYHLAEILKLEEHTLQYLHTRIGELVYRNAFAKVIADGRLSNGDMELLNRLQHALQLSKALTEKIATEMRAAFVQEYVSGVIARMRFSPAEERELHDISSSLHVVIQLSEQTKSRLHKLKCYWAIENEQLPVVHTTAVLQKDEECYFTSSGVRWYEWRGTRNIPGSSDVPMNFREIKACYFNKTGNGRFSYGADVMKLVDEGTLYVTSKRIILAGGVKNSLIRLDGISGLIASHEGVEIRKSTGKNAILRLGEQADMFCMLLQRVLNDVNGIIR